MAFITIRLIRSPGVVSGVISFLTGLPSHAEALTPEGTWLGAHAGSGIQERDYDYIEPVWERRYAIPCTDAQLAAMMAWGRSKIGVANYDYWDVIGIAIHDRKMHHLGDYDCSEFVTVMLALQGIELFNIEIELAYLVTPRDIHLSPVLRGKLLPGSIG